MLNTVEFYADLGRKAAQARNHQDEACAQFHAEHFRQAKALEKRPDAQRANAAYRDAYAAVRNVTVLKA